SRRSSGLSALPCQHLQARVNRLVGAHRCAGLQRSSVLKHQADGFLIGAMVRGGTRSPTVCTKHWPDAALVPPPRQATTYKRLQPRALACGGTPQLPKPLLIRDNGAGECHKANAQRDEYW